MNNREDVINRKIRNLEKVLNSKPTVSIEVSLESVPCTEIFDSCIGVSYCFPELPDSIYDDTINSFNSIELELLERVDYDFNFLEITGCKLGDQINNNNIDSDKEQYLPYMQEIMTLVEAHIRWRIARLKRDLELI